MQSSIICVHHLPNTNQLYHLDTSTSTNMLFETEYPFYASMIRDNGMFWGATSNANGEGVAGDSVESIGGLVGSGYPPLPSEKQGSHTPTSSIINIGPEITMTTPGTTGSYVMVHNRREASLSNRCSPVGSAYSVPNSVPSHDAAEWVNANTVENMDVDGEGYGMPHDTAAMLFNMSGPGMFVGRVLILRLT
jgi:hypothetical protein